MIVGYKSDLTLDEQLQSFRDNVQLALNEQQMLIDQIQKSIEVLKERISSLEES